MPPYRDVLPPDSSFYEACARHTSRTTSRALQHIYLCDTCAIRLTKEAFNDRPPIYHGETVDGFCGLCNARTSVTLRQWFVCSFCWNVVVSYQKAFVASQAVLAFWARDILPRFPNFSIQETECVYCGPYQRGKSTKKQAAATLKILDFLVSEARDGKESPVFHIELKAGPGSIDTMSEFQLDVNDSNDIAGAVAYTGLPAYIFHVQLDYEYSPPTRRAVAKGMWWTDVLKLEANRTAVRLRRGDQKQAGYYSTAAFQPIATFPKELATRRFDQLRESILASPVELL